MAITTIKANNEGAWDKARAVPTGHFVDYVPGPRIMRLHDPNGQKIAETGIPEGARDFSPYVAASGEIHVIYSSFNNDQTPWPWKRWTTGAFVGTAPAPPPAPTNNAAKIQALREVLDQARAILDTLT